jgi:hypothetical protein
MAKDRDSLRFLVAASVLAVLLSFIPFAGIIVYPFRLFVTFIHEGGHALAALLTFGSVEQVRLHLDASGETYTRGGMPLVVSSAGYLSSTVYGAGLLLLGRQSGRAKAALALTALAIAGLTLLYVRGVFGWMVGIGLTVGLVLTALAASVRAAHFILSFLAVQCCLNALYDLNTLFFISAFSNSHSDARNMQSFTGIPAVFWAIVWLVVSLMVLAQALKSYARRA